jgi:leucyl aminopeptidase (aminopeptidase T)
MSAPPPDLDRAVHTVIHDCLAVHEGESVLIVCNPATQRIGERMRDEASAAGADAVLAIMDERTSHAAEPPPPIADAMLRADVILAPTVQSLSHTAARNAASEAGARTATLPGVTEEMLARVMSADVEGLRRHGQSVANALEAASEATITSADDAVLRLMLGGRPGIPDSGDIRARGAFGNLPAGEGFISPVGGEGTLVVDGSIASIGIVSEPARLTVADGRLVAASGPEGERLYELLSMHGEDGTRIAELGIGTNEKAILTGEILEDEKILGTCHVAFGASAGIGGTVQVPVHLDCVITRPTVALDGEPILRDGDLFA